MPSPAPARRPRPPDRRHRPTPGRPSHPQGRSPLGLDLVDRPSGPLDYLLRIGHQEFHRDQPSIRVLPAQLLAAAGLPVISTTDRQLRRGARPDRTGHRGRVHQLALVPFASPTPSVVWGTVNGELTGSNSATDPA